MVASSWFSRLSVGTELTSGVKVQATPRHGNLFSFIYLVINHFALYYVNYF